MSDGDQFENGQDMSSNQEGEKDFDYASSQQQFSDDESQMKAKQNEDNENQNQEDQDIMEGDIQKANNNEEAIIKINQDQPRFKVPKQQRRTLDCISKYEYAKVIGMRANQISKNSPIYIQIQTYQGFKMKSAIQIAQLQYKQKKLPYTIHRPLPGGFYEEWDLHQLDDLNV